MLHKKFLIYGSQDFGQVVKNIVADTGNEFAGYIDDFNKGKDILGTFAQIQSKYATDEYCIALAIGYNNQPLRLEIFKKIIASGFQLPALVHPHSYVCKTCTVEDGVIIMENAIISYRAKIGATSVLWPGSVISHDSTIGKNCFISPNATICGFAKVGDSCFVGAGAVVVDHREMAPNTRLKALEVHK
nr:hypothetical protein [uncultured Pseudodesulfovibrio sp.]